jgi:hypothetical protein
METWNFQLKLNRAVTDEEMDQLYEAGLNDAAITSGGIVDVDREAPSLLEAVISAVAQVRAVKGLFAVMLLEDDAVTLTDAAQRLGGVRTAESLRLLAEGRRGPGTFPAPIADTGRIRVYSWAQISEFLAELGDEVPRVDSDLTLANWTLRLHAEAARVGPDRVEAIERLFEAA